MVMNGTNFIRVEVDIPFRVCNDGFIGPGSLPESTGSADSPLVDVLLTCTEPRDTHELERIAHHAQSDYQLRWP